MPEPVFYDPERARWKRLRRFVDALVVAISALVIFFVYTALRDEHLPELLFSPQKRAFKALKENEREKARDRLKKAAVGSHRKSKLPASEVNSIRRKAFARHSTFRGTQPASLPCAISPGKSIYFIRTGCTCLLPMGGCRGWMTRPTSFLTWCKTIACVPLTIA